MPFWSVNIDSLLPAKFIFLPTLWKSGLNNIMVLFDEWTEMFIQDDINGSFILCSRSGLHSTVSLVRKILCAIGTYIQYYSRKIYQQVTFYLLQVETLPVMKMWPITSCANVQSKSMAPCRKNPALSGNTMTPCLRAQWWHRWWVNSILNKTIWNVVGQSNKLEYSCGSKYYAIWIAYMYIIWSIICHKELCFKW